MSTTTYVFLKKIDNFLIERNVLTRVTDMSKIHEHKMPEQTVKT